MTRPRRSFTDEFKREAVALLASSGRPLMQIAEELGLRPSMLRNWRTAVGGPAGASRRPDTPAAPPQPGGSGHQSAGPAALRREVERLRMERDIPKKSCGPLLGTAETRFRCIEDQRGTWPVRVLCDTLEVSASGYHAWRRRRESLRAVANRALLAHIRCINER
jgi:transposase